MTTREQLDHAVAEVLPAMLDLRHDLHVRPEPSFQEHATTRRIVEFLTAHGLSPRLRSPRTGAWVDTIERPAIGFRADLDAVPIQEPEANRPRSIVDGWMHACGHDVHAAIAAGIAVAGARLGLGVRVLFQPAEETQPGGAAEMARDGLVDGLRALIAYHVDPELISGEIGLRSGPITASSDVFTIRLEGPGGHTARPHRTVDLIDAAARIAHELPAAIQRSTDPRAPLVIAFGSIHGGHAANVIPTSLELRGTARTLSREVWESLPRLFEKVLGAQAGATGARCELDYRTGIPPVVNDDTVAATVGESIRALGVAETVLAQQSMGGEDFGQLLEVVPGALLRLGIGPGSGDLHSAGFRVNEAAIEVGLKGGLAALSGLAGLG